MLVLNDRPTIFVDVDETLVSFDTTVEGHSLLLPNGSTVYVNQNVLDKIEEFHNREHQIVVWSAGGANWAKTIVETLGIEYMVLAVMSKPAWFFDDQPALNFMPEANRIHMNFDGTYKKTGMHLVPSEDIG